MVTTFYPPFNFGGDGVFIQQLVNELAGRGHDVEVIHCTDAYRVLAGKTPAPEDSDHPHVKVHRLHSRFGFLSPLATQQTGFPLFKSSSLKEILNRPFDVIHYHNISLVGGPKVLEYGQGVKLYSLHEYWLICPTHMLFRYNAAPCTERHCFMCTLAHKRPPQLWRYLQMIEEFAKHVDVFIAPSEFVKKKHLEMGLRVPIVELPYFTSRWQYGPTTPYDPQSQDPYFLFVGRLEKLKGLQTLIPMFRRYPKARLLVVGTGSYERTLWRLAEGCDNVKFLGYQSGEQLRVLYEQAVAVIVPSIWYEVFGQVIIEAFAQKTPVIVRRIGGMPAIVEENGGGFVYDTDEELLEALAKLLEDAILRRMLGLRGFEVFQRKWTADVHLQSYLKLIEDVLATRSGRRRERDLSAAE